MKTGGGGGGKADIPDEKLPTQNRSGNQREQLVTRQFV